jgi:pSer/pThr/pTyr-binding forkhead associated (FHA) protein
MALRLFIARGHNTGQQFIAVQPMVFIGRDPSCDVVLADDGVSGRHVRITEREGRYFASDLHSSNGTTLNGKPLVVEREVGNGDALGVGMALVQLGVLEVPDATERRRLVPTGVEVASHRQTGEHAAPKVAVAKGSDDETTLPSGRPLPKEDLPTPPPRVGAARLPWPSAPRPTNERNGPIDRTRYDSDADETSPIARPLTELPEPTPKVSLPPPSWSMRDGAVTQQGQVSSTRKRLGPQGSPQDPASLSAISPTAGTAKDLAKIPERDRETGEQPRPPRGDTVDTGPELTPVTSEGVAIKDNPTMMVPPLPPTAEPLTALDQAMIAEPRTRLEPAMSPLESAPSVLVPASALLRRPPDAANPDTPLGGATVIDEPADRVPRERALPQQSAALEGQGPGAQSEQPETAADRARRRREARATLGGALRWHWSELTVPARSIIAALLAFAAAGTAWGLWAVFRPPVRYGLPPEPGTLSSRPMPYSFGVGEVDYEHVDLKELRFEVKSPTAAAVVVHYRAHDIANDEVAISINGSEVGFVPADVGAPDRELEVLLSQFVVLRGGPNVLVFDDVKNPPGKERWRVSDLWMELIPVLEATPEQASAAAKEAYARAEVLEKQRTSGDDTLFSLWRIYRQGWLALLPLRDDKRGWLWGELKRRADAARAELDVLCGKLMLDAKKQMELKNPDRAKEILEGVPRFFPTRDHPCQAIAEDKLREYDL